MKRGFAMSATQDTIPSEVNTKDSLRDTQARTVPSPGVPCSGKQWIAACEFQPLSKEEVLNAVLHRVQATVKQGRTPVVLLDLDSTLYEVTPRSHAILKEWAQSHHAGHFPMIRTAVAQLPLDEVRYSVHGTLSQLNLFVPPVLLNQATTSAKDFWVKRFFTDEYLQHDRPYTGAAEFVRRVHAEGAQVVYLTGRDEPNMGKATRENLIRDQFPWNVPCTHLLMKPKYGLDDLEFKTEALREIESLGSLVASFENEPPNVVEFFKLFPNAMHIFVDTVWSDRPALPIHGLYRIESFG